MSVDSPLIYPQGAGQFEQVQFWWEEPVSTGGYPLSHYTIQCPDVPFSGSYPAGVKSAIIPVPNGINYLFTITATNTNGVTSEPAEFAVISAGYTPDSIATIFVDVISTSYAQVSWSVSVLPDQQAIHSFLLYAIPSTPTLSTLRFAVKPFERSYDFIGYTASYSFRVIAVGTGASGTERIISTPVASMAGGARPIRSTTLIINSPTVFTISWTGSQNATSFQFVITPDDGSAPFFQTPTTLINQIANFTNCDSWINYRFGPGYGIMIIALNSNGASYSETNTIHFGALPASSLTYTNVTPSSFNLVWYGANGASSFQFSLDSGSTIINNSDWSYGSNAIGSTLFTGLNYGSSFSGAVVYAFNGISTIVTASRGPYSSFILTPGPATNFVVSLITQSSFTLSWSGAQGASAITYLGTAATTTIGTNGPAFYTGLSAGSYYSTIVVPINSSGSGVAAGTLIKTTPEAVTNVQQSVGSGDTLNITWSGSVGAENYGYRVGTVVSGPVYESTIQAVIVSGLTPNTTYSTAIIAYAVVFPTSGLVGSTLSDYVNLTTGPAAATNLVISNIGSDRFSVGWSGAVGASSLIFHYNSSVITVPAVGIANPYVLTGLAQNANYVVYIDSVNIYGLTSSVSISQFTGIGIPVLSTSTATSNGFTVYWSGADNASSITFYYNNTFATVSQQSGPAYVVSGLLPNSTYTIYGVAQTENSQRSTLTYSQLTAPTLPTNIGLTEITATQIIVSWSDGVTSSLTLYYGASSVVVYASPYTISDLAPNTSYGIYFEATNAVANYSTVAINQTTGPGPATGLSISNVQALQFNVGWSGAVGASSFTFFYNTSSITVGAAAASVPYTLTGLAANTDYIVYINTTNSIANSSSLTVSQLTAPSVPTGLSIGSVTETTMAISWVGGVGSSFTFFYGPESITVGGSVTSPYTISSLAANTSYLVYIVATNQTAAVSTLGVTQFTAPSATSGVNVTVISYSTIAVAWTTGQGASSLTFYYNASSLTVSGLQTSPYFISSLNAGSTYTVYIETIADSGLRTSSNSVSVLTVPAPAQVLSAANNTPSSFAIGWSGAQGASSLTFLYNTSSLTVSASQSSPYSISSLSAGAAYAIYVNATNATGTVSSQSIIAYTAATAPYNLEASNFSLSSFAVSWSGPLGASSLTFVYNSASLTVPGTQTSPYTISSLNQSTTYVVYMNATTSGGLVTSSLYITATTYVAPAPATGLSASNNTVSSFAVAWGNAANASSLTFYYNGSSLTVAASQTSPYTISSLTAGSSYTVYIDTVNIGAVVSSQSIIAYTAAYSASNLSASNFSLSSFAVAWSGALGASSLTFVYNSASLTVPGTETSPYTISSLNQSTTYVVYMNATTSGGLVTSSLYITATTYVAPAPATGLSASNNTVSSFAVGWSGAANASSLTFYYNGSSLTVAASQTSPYTISSLTAGSSYTVYIDTVNIGAVVSSQSIIAYTAAYSASNLSASNFSLSSFAVAWSGALGASSLTFVYNSASLTVPGTETSPYTISSLNQSTTYVVYMNATTSGGLVTSSLYIAATTYVAPAPATSLSAGSNTGSSFAVAWSGAANASSLIFYYNGSSLTVAASQTSPYTISSLTAGSSYTVYIDTVNIGAVVSSQSIIAYTAALAATNLSASNFTLTSFAVAWSGAQGASSLTFVYNSASLTVPATETSPYTISSLAQSTTYAVYINATTSGGLVTSSLYITAETYVSASAPVGLVASNNRSDSFAISWSGAANASSLTFYYNGSSLTVAASQTSPYTISSLASGSSYTVYIDAVNIGSAVSSQSIIAYTAPAIPDNLNVNVISYSTLSVVWTGAQGASSLTFYYNTSTLTVLGSQTSPYLISSLYAGSSYTIYIDAIADSGLRTSSNSISVLTDPKPAQVLLASLNTPSSFAIGWSGAEGASSLTFLYNTSSITVPGNSANPYTISYLVAGSEYLIGIDVTEGFGPAISSNQIVAYTRPVGPAGLASSGITASSVTLNWSGVVGASSLVFYYNSISVGIVAQPAPYILTSLTPGSTYSIYLDAIASSGLNASSNTISVLTAPLAATAVATSNYNNTSFEITWSGAEGASSLTFYYNSNSVTVANQASPYTLTTVTAGSTYSVYIDASNATASVASGITNGYTSAYAASSLSYNNPTVSSFAVAWSGAAGASSLVFLYNDFMTTVSANTVSPLTIATSLGAGSTYTVFISSITSYGLVTTSNSLTAYTSAYAATSLSYNNLTVSSFAIAWSGAEGASSLVFFYNNFTTTVTASTVSPLTITASVGAGSTYTVFISSITSGGLITTSNSVVGYTPAYAAASLSYSNPTVSSFAIAWSGAAGASSLTFLYNNFTTTVAASTVSPLTITSSVGAGSTYTVFISSITSGGLVTTSDSVVGYTPAYAAASLSYSNPTVTSFDIAWSGAAGASSLVFFYNDFTTTITASTVSSLTITASVGAGSTYTVFISSITSGGLVTTSNSVIGYTPAYAPTSLSAGGLTSNSANISWSGAEGASSLVFHYNSNIVTVPASQTSPYTLNTLTAGSSFTIYIDSVTANSGLVTSSQSISVLTAPTAATSTATSSYSQTSFQISWSGAQGASSLTFSYNSNSVTVVNQASPYTLTGLTAGSTYTVSIDATNATANVSSVSVNGYTTAFAATGLVSSNQSATSFAIGWSGAAGASSLTFNYNTSTITVPASQSSPYTISSLATNTNYTVYITTTTSAGFTTNSSSITTATILDTPTAITNVSTILLLDTFVTVGWSGGVGATSYTYLLNGGSATPSSDNGVVSKSASFNNLTANTSYSLRITAINANGSTIYNSIGSLFTTQPPPPPPTAITNISTILLLDTFVTVGWSGGVGATSYTYLLNGASAIPSIDNGVTSKSASFNNVSSGTTYVVVITAINSGGSTSSGAINDTSSLRLWLDGKDPLNTGVVPTTGTFIPSWLDRSGLGNNATGVNSPTYTPSGFKLDGVNQYFTTTITSQSASETIFIVYKLDANTQAGLVDTNASGGRALQHLPAKNGPSLAKSGVTWLLDGTYVTTTGVTYIATLTYSSSGINIYVTGNTSSSNTTNPGFTAGTTWIGAGFNSQWYLNGTISEVLIYNAVLTTAKRQEAEGYLAWKWGLQTSLPTNHPYKSVAPGMLTFRTQRPIIPTEIRNLSTSVITETTVTVGWSGGVGATSYTYLLNGVSTIPSSDNGVTSNSASFSNLSSATIYAVVITAVNSVGSSSNRSIFSNVDGVKLWLDGSDPLNTGVVPSNGTTISSWKDKSGNAYDGAKYSSGTVTLVTNSLNSLSGVSMANYGFSLCPIPPGTFIDALTIFVVYKGTTTGSGLVTRTNLSTNPNLGNPLDIQFNSGNTYFVVGPNSARSSVFTHNLNNTSASIFNLNLNQVNSSVGFNSNGTSVTTGGVSAWTASDTGNVFTVGGRPDNGVYTNATFYEVVVFNTNLSIGARQYVEGYLAWKWGLQTVLPANHPNKSAVPATFSFTTKPPPTAITNIRTTDLTVTSATVAWSGGVGATSYMYLLNGVSATPSSDNGVASKSATFSSLDPATTYVIVIIAINAGGSSSSRSPFSNIDGVKLWLDGSDPLNTGVVPSNGTTISSWKDKSSNAYHGAWNNLGSVTLVRNSLNSLSGVYTASGGFIKCPVPAGTFLDALTIFVVFKGTGVGNSLVTRTNSVTSPNLGNPLDMQGTTTYTDFAIGANNARNVRANGYSMLNTTPSIFNMNINQTNSSVTLISNGTSVTISTPAAWTASDTGDLFTVGGRGDNGTNTTTNFYEVVVFNTILSIGSRQYVEGYLAWKWGLQTVLPVNHPYISAAPTGFSFTTQLPPPASAVVNVTTTELTGESVTVGWSGGSGAIRYTYLLNGVSATPLSDNGVASKTATFSNLVPSTVYLIRITAINAGGSSSSDGSPSLASFGGLHLWLDGKDPLNTGTPPSNGASIATWFDKSGNSYNTTAKVGTGNITYNNDSGVYFPGVPNFDLSDGSFPVGNSAYTIYFVGSWDNPANNGVFSFGSNSIALWNNGGGTNFYPGTSANNLTNTGFASNQKHQMSFTYVPGLSVTSAIDGIFPPPSSAVVTTPVSNNVPATGNFLGKGVGVNMLGYISEMIVFNVAHDTGTRQIIEGYLAWKWGAQTYLPANHPYKSVAPIGLLFKTQAGSPPTAITSVTTSGLTDTSVTIGWSGGVGATSYRYLLNGVNAIPSSDNGVTSKSATFSNLVSGITYSLIITAVSAGGSTSNSSSPASLGGLHLWLDGKDPLNTGTTLPNGVSITKWFDKSGNSYNTTAKVGTGNITYNNDSGVYFPGVPNFDLPSGSFPVGNSAYTIYFVASFDNPSNHSGFAFGSNAVALWNSGGTTSFWAGTATTLTNIGFAFNQKHQMSFTYVPGVSVTDITDGIYPPTATGTIITNPVSNNVAATGNFLGKGVGVNMLGFISEMIVFNVAHTENVRQAVEGYLAAKWSAQTYLPANHPYKSVAPVGFQFRTIGNPLSPNASLGVPGIQLWFDASDPLATGVGVSNGANIPVWYDKSGNGFNTTEVRGSITYSSTTGGLTFNGSSGFTFPNGALPFGNSPFSWYVVSRVAVNNRYYIMGGGGAGADGKYAYIFLYPANQNLYLQMGPQSMNGPFVLNQTFLFDGLYDSDTGNGFSVFNGGSLSTPSNIVARSMNNGPNYIGSGFDTVSDVFNGAIMEILVYNVFHTTVQRQIVEGYLARKWDLQARLPAGHPYKSIEPTVTFRTLASPTPIINITTTGLTGTSVTVGWSGASGATGYTYLLNGVNAIPSSDNGVASKTATFSNLVPGTVYLIRITATNANGSTSNISSPLLASFGGLHLWLDGKDPLNTGITLPNGVPITKWFDKSGNAYNTTAKVGTGDITYNNDSGVYFPGTPHFDLPSGSFPVGNSAYTIYFVASFDNPSNHSGFAFGSNAVALWNSGGTTYFYPGTTTTLTNIGFAGNQKHQMSFTYVPGVSVTDITDGIYPPTATGTVTTTPVSNNVAATSNFIGKGVGTNMLGFISEIIVFNVAHDAGTRQIIEGYLAWKWSSQTYLPANHPYKSVAPIGFLFKTLAGSPPTAITNVTMTELTDTSVTVGWSGGVGATSYRYLLNGVNAIPSSDNGVTSKSATFSNLVSVIYSLIITAVNDGGSTSNSSSPASLGGLHLWLDGKDPLNTGITLPNNVPITKWFDKSGNAYNTTAKVGSGDITFNNDSGIYFPGTPNFDLPSGSFPVGNSAYTIYFVASWNNPANQSGFSFGSNAVALWNNGGTTSFYPGTATALTNTGFAANQKHQMSFTYIPGTSATTVTDGIFPPPTSAVTTTPAANNVSATSNFLGKGVGTNMLGYISEMIIFNVAHSTNVRQAVEGYLAWKWSTQTYLPSSHPYKSVAPIGFQFRTNVQAFTPISVPGIQMWFDASDPLATGTSVSTGTVVSTWYDKSGNGLNTSTMTGSIPYNSTTGGLTFNGSSRFTLSPRSWPYGNSPWSIYIISNITSGDPTIIGWGDNNGNGYIRILFDNATKTIRLYPELTSTDLYTNGQNVMFTGSFDAAAGNEYLNLNGGILNGPASVGTRNIAFSTGCIGANNDGGAMFNGTIYEILIYNVFHTITQRQMLEGYLANKWGLQARLPAAHPYKSTVPTIAYTPALSFEQPIYWFDGSNTSALTLSGNSVTGFTNQGLAGNTTLAINVTRGTAINSLSTITFGRGGSRYFALPTYNPNSYLASMFVVFQGTSTTDISGAYWFFQDSPTVSSAPDIFLCKLNSGSRYIGVDVNNEINYNLSGPPINATDTTYTAPSLISGVTNINSTSLPHGAWSNGTNVYTVSKNSGGTTTTTYTNPYLGNFRSDSVRYNMAEYVHFPNVLTTEQRQKVEGYLAWKWGLQSSLPPSHPYYSVIPTAVTATTTASTVPKSIPGLRLWFDASDPLATGTPPANGANIAVWYDKSGNAYNTTGGNTNATYSAAGLVFNGNSYYSLPDGCLPFNNTPYSYFFVLRSPTTNSINPVFSGGNTSGSRRCVSFKAFSDAKVQTTWFTQGTYSTTTSYPANQPFLTCSLYSSSAQQIVGVNGNINSQTVTVKREQVPTTNWIGYSVDTASTYFNGTICEILCYNICLETSQREKVEGYLAWKWGIQSSLPYSHPYAYLAPGATEPPYTPRAFAGVSGIQMWFDASDPVASGTGVSNNTLVNRWHDKSGYDFHTTVITGTIPYNSTTGGLTFNGTSYYALLDRALPFGNSAYSIYVVAICTAGIQQGLIGGGTAGGSYLNLRYRTDAPIVDSIQTMWYNNDLKSSIVLPGGTPFLFASLWNSTTRTTFANGTTAGSDTPSIRSQPNSNNWIGTVSYSVGTANLNGTMYEIQVYNIAHTAVQRQRVEGYLAWKWGLQSSLPVGHPYYSAAPPTTLRTFPESLPGIQLWFDAADPLATGTGVSNGTAINIWYDKSRNGFNTSAVTGTIPTYNSTTGGLTFNGTNFFTLPNGALPFGDSPFSIYAVVNPNNVDCCVICGGTTQGALSMSFFIFANSNKFVLLQSGGSQSQILNNLNSQAILVQGLYDSDSRKSYVAVNGGVRASITTGPGTIPSGPNYIGCDTATSSKVNGTIYEILVYKTFHTTAKQQKVEGYLAWKWNLQASLPTNHPYKNVAPYV